MLKNFGLLFAILIMAGYSMNATVLNGDDPNQNKNTDKSAEGTVATVPTSYYQIVWHYGRDEMRAWQYRYYDDWLGKNEWCNAKGEECHQYDWRATYPLKVCNPPSYTITSEYGHGKVIDALNADGIDIPESDLGYPEVRQSVIEE